MPGFVSSSQGLSSLRVRQRRLRGNVGRTRFPEAQRARGVSRGDCQGFYELLDQAYATGEAYTARAMPLHLDNPVPSAADLFIDLFRTHP